MKRTESYKTITIQGREEDIETICQFLSHVEYLGNIGSSRNILLRVDGDGAGRMHFYDYFDGCSISCKDHFNIEESGKRTEVVGVYDIG